MNCSRVTALGVFSLVSFGCQVDRPLGDLENAGGEGGAESGGSSNGGSPKAGSSAGGSPTGGSTSGGSEAGGSGSGGSGGGGSGGGGSGGGACGCVESQISWGMNGGLVAYTETSTLTPCATFVHSRSTSPSIACVQEITSCAGGVGPRSVDEALAHPDVRAAVASAPVLYGFDVRAVDGQVLRIDIGGDVVEVGRECGTTPDCTPIPSGVADLADLLRSLTDQELARGQCADAFGGCFSPDIHPELALIENAIGCPCMGTEMDACVAVPGPTDLHLIGLVCDDGRWHSVEDGPCEGEGPMCLVGNRIYLSGQHAPHPFSFCNECVCAREGLSECTNNDCANTRCPSGMLGGTRCARCGGADQCDIVEHACIPTCMSDEDCPDEACVEGLCKVRCAEY